MKPAYLILLFLIITTMLLSDLLVVSAPIFGRIGIAVWIVSYGFIIWLGLRALGSIISFATHERQFATILLIGLHMALILFHMTYPRSLSFETTMQVACALDQWGYDRGYRAVCMVGYPIRQYFLAALPTVLVGRSMIALHTGQSLYFLLGLPIFAAGLLQYLKPVRYRDLITAGILALIWHIHFFNHFMYYYEQSIYPLSFALILTGTYLMFLTKPAAWHIGMGALVLLYAVYSYTSSLSLVPLGIVLLLWIAALRKFSSRMRALAVLCVFLVGIGMLLSIQYRGDLNFVESGRSLSHLVDDARDTLYRLVSAPDNSYRIMTPLLAAGAIGVIVGSLFFAFGWKAAVIALWILGVILVAGISKGYVYYGIDFRLHRATVVFPVVFALFAWIYRRYADRLQLPRYYYIVGFLILLIVGLQFHWRYTTTRYESRNVYLMYWMLDAIPKPLQDAGGSIYFDKSLDIYTTDSFGSYDAYLRYFLPKYNSKILTDENCNPLLAESDRVNNQFIATIPDSPKSYCYYIFQQKLEYFGTFSNKSEVPISLYRIITDR